MTLIHCMLLNSEMRWLLFNTQLPAPNPDLSVISSLRSCLLPIVPLCLSREEGVIFFSSCLVRPWKKKQKKKAWSQVTLLASRFITGSPSSKYERRRTSALLRNVIYFECYATMPMFAIAHISSLGYLWIQIKRLVFTLMLASGDLTLPGLLIFLGGRYSCLVPRSHYSMRSMHFGSQGLRDIISDTSPTWIDRAGLVQWLGKGGGTPNLCLTGGVPPTPTQNSQNPLDLERNL